MKVSVWKIVLGLVLIALLVGGGLMLYRAGYLRGAMSNLSFEDMPFANGGHGYDYDEMTPYGGYYGMGRGMYSHFSFGRMLFGGFIFLLVVGGILRLVFGGMWRHGYMPPWAAYRTRYEGEGASWMRNHPYWGKMPEEDEDVNEGADK